jgi:hypothetical protein
LTTTVYSHSTGNEDVFDMAPGALPVSLQDSQEKAEGVYDDFSRGLEYCLDNVPGL